jgi:hypothetical protein
MDAARMRGKFNGATTLAVIAAFLFANLLCATPQLHEKIHGQSLNHECAVTLVATGKFELGAAPLLAPLSDSTAEFSRVITRPAVSVPSLFLNAAIFEHAPPAVA